MTTAPSPYPWTIDKNRSWVPGYGPGVTTNPAESTTPNATGPPGTDYKTAPGVSAQSAHQMIVATGIVIVVVYIMVIIAGMSKDAGRAVLALFGMAIVIQGLGHTGSIINFVNKKPLTRSKG
jgi:hypothetical protein